MYSVVDDLSERLAVANRWIRQMEDELRKRPIKVIEREVVRLVEVPGPPVDRVVERVVVKEVPVEKIVLKTSAEAAREIRSLERALSREQTRNFNLQQKIATLQNHTVEKPRGARPSEILARNQMPETASIVAPDRRTLEFVHSLLEREDWS